MPNALINVSSGWSAFTHYNKTRFSVYFIAVMVILTVI